MGQVQEKEQQDEERRQWKKQEEKQNYGGRELTRKPVWPLENCVWDTSQNTENVDETLGNRLNTSLWRQPLKKFWNFMNRSQARWVWGIYSHSAMHKLCSQNFNFLCNPSLRQMLVGVFLVWWGPRCFSFYARDMRWALRYKAKSQKMAQVCRTQRRQSGGRCNRSNWQTQGRWSNITRNSLIISLYCAPSQESRWLEQAPVVSHPPWAKSTLTCWTMCTNQGSHSLGR